MGKPGERNTPSASRAARLKGCGRVARTRDQVVGGFEPPAAYCARQALGPVHAIGLHAEPPEPGPPAISRAKAVARALACASGLARAFRSIPTRNGAVSGRARPQVFQPAPEVRACALRIGEGKEARQAGACQISASRIGQARHVQSFRPDPRRAPRRHP